VISFRTPADSPARRLTLLVLLAGSLCAAVASLVWFAYRATQEWRRSTALLVEQRSEQALTLLTVALSRDMKGVHDSVLAPFSESALDLDRAFELGDLFAQSFARFPYPESFFVWREQEGMDRAMVFNRVDRQPPWDASRAAGSGYPVVTLRDSPVAAALTGRTRALGVNGRQFAAFETELGDQPYQVVVHLLYQTAGRRQLLGAVGFTVNLHWVNDHYFRDILGQIAAIGHVEQSIALAIADDRGSLVAGTRTPDAGGIVRARPFPLAFYDADLVNEQVDDIAPPRVWSASVGAFHDRTLAAAAQGSARTLWLISLAAAVAIMGVLLTLRAMKARADLAVMQSDFMASTTHELKTPLAVFQLVAETLAKRRYHSDDTIRTYAGLLSHQVQLLERLIDNLLSYASISTVTERHAFGQLSVADVVETALERFDARLAASGMEVRVEIPRDLPSIHGDRQTLVQAFDNVLDNAIKYSPGADVLLVRAAATPSMIHIEITDHGVGIPENDREKVFQKFYRGKNATVGGSGLGLAIVRRVLEYHGGRVEIRGAEPQGTTVAIDLPIARLRSLAS
jgi:signal transduction histidine kinase